MDIDMVHMAGDPPLLYAKGHQEPQEFLTAARAYLEDEDEDLDYCVPLGPVEYGWARKVPDGIFGEYTWLWWPVGSKVRDSRGVFPYTAVHCEWRSQK